MHSDRKLAVVLGANGGLGGEVTRALLRHGWHVRALTRPSRAATDDYRHPLLERIVGDVLRREDVMNAALGAAVIVHAVNPANYHDWRGLAIPMLENTIAAASMRRATVVFPGSIYNYGVDAFPILDEASPQQPQTRKGRIRVELEGRLRDASWDAIRALIVRCGDFFGPRAPSSWLSQGMLSVGRPPRLVLNPGSVDRFHTWAYLPDVAETIARLLEHRRALPSFDTFHMRGHYLSNQVMLDAVCRAAELSSRRVLPFPWWTIRAAAPFSELCNEMLEMRYLWDQSIEMSNAKLVGRLGYEPHTPLDDALRATLAKTGDRNSNSPPIRPNAPAGSR